MTDLYRIDLFWCYIPIERIHLEYSHGRIHFISDAQMNNWALPAEAAKLTIFQCFHTPDSRWMHLLALDALIIDKYE